MTRMKTIFAAMLIAGVVGLSGCDMRRLGPPLYETFSKEYLEKNGFSADIVSAVCDGKAIDHDTFLVLAKVPDTSVKHMLARNPHLSREERQMLFKDKDQFVRQGVAMNPALDREEISQALSDSSSFVWGALAMNPAVPADVLLELRIQRHVSLHAFAQNTNCPVAIVREIEESKDTLAKQLLGITRRVHGGPKPLTTITNTEQGTPPLPSSPRAGPSEGAR